MAKKKSKAFMDDSGQRLVLAAVAGGKIFGEAFTKCFDTYIEKHEASEKKEEGGWLGDLLTNSAKSMEELLRHLSKLPKKVVDTYLEEDKEDKDKNEEEAPKKEIQKEIIEKEKEENDKNENKNPPIKAQGKTTSKAASSKKSVH